MSVHSPQSKRLLVTFAVELDSEEARLADVRNSLESFGAGFPSASIRVVESRAQRRPRPPRPIGIRTGRLHSYE